MTIGYAVSPTTQKPGSWRAIHILKRIKRTRRFRRNAGNGRKASGHLGRTWASLSQPRSKVFADSWNKLREVCYQDEKSKGLIKRNDHVEKALQFTNDAFEEVGIPAVKRTIRRKKIMTGEKAADEPLHLDQELKSSMLECIDMFQQEINTRCEGMECISDRFAVLESSNLIETSETELPKFVQSLEKSTFQKFDA
ncbi:hypothetical protein AVEN_34234-1 [Araneus ventricosus]|uniref:Uncharacterized protein n=1 Tax=Araneus ventricosus TaxID=182803 RepID=A0A4Y2QV35_ARAVE|nr:hypothetical protein AVEN_34234-1 [Araneus ventricosus]